MSCEYPIRYSAVPVPIRLESNGWLNSDGLESFATHALMSPSGRLRPLEHTSARILRVDRRPETYGEPFAAHLPTSRTGCVGAMRTQERQADIERWR
jgi:hypothetical protein